MYLTIKVHVGTPDDCSRKSMIRSFMSGIKHRLSEESIARISQMTFGWSGSEIEVTRK
jgi:hypothetical protein